MFIFVIFGKLIYLTMCLCEFKFTDADNKHGFEATKCFCFCQYDHSLNVCKLYVLQHVGVNLTWKLTC